MIVAGNLQALTNMKTIKVIVEKYSDGYVAYPVGLKDVVVGYGQTCDDALTDVRLAIHFHIETFGADTFYDADNSDQDQNDS